MYIHICIYISSLLSFCIEFLLTSPSLSSLHPTKTLKLTGWRGDECNMLDLLPVEEIQGYGRRISMRVNVYSFMWFSLINRNVSSESNHMGR
jgi:hypothetical protein